MKETALMHAIMLALSNENHVCFRANVGTFRTQDGRWFSTGLPPGFSDLFGFTSTGKPYFMEVKTEKGAVRPDQVLFLEAMRNRGAIVGIVRSVDDALKLLN